MYIYEVVSACGGSPGQGIGFWVAIVCRSLFISINLERVAETELDDGLDGLRTMGVVRESERLLAVQNCHQLRRFGRIPWPLDMITTSSRVKCDSKVDQVV